MSLGYKNVSKIKYISLWLSHYGGLTPANSQRPTQALAHSTFLQEREKEEDKEGLWAMATV